MAGAIGSSSGLSIVSKLTELSVKPIKRQFRYVLCFKSFVKELDDQKENLALAQDRVQKDVTAAKRRGEEIQKDVEKWLTDAETIMEDVMLLRNKIRNNRSCFRWCPNLLQQHRLGRAAAKKITTLQELGNETNSIKFERVGNKLPVESIDFLPSKNFTPSKFSISSLKQIMEALKDDKIHIIAMYGMPGVGKTTLVKEVGRKAKELELFEVVLMVVVSQTPNATHIQERVIDDLNLEVKEKTEEGRANRLFSILKKEEKRVLIILDDVWSGFGVEDLNNIGIPFDDAQKDKGWKILLTTRSVQVCNALECQRKVVLQVFSED